MASGRARPVSRIVAGGVAAQSASGRSSVTDPSGALPGVSRAARSRSPESGAEASNAIMRVPGFGESHSWRGPPVPITCQRVSDGERSSIRSRSSPSTRVRPAPDASLVRARVIIPQRTRAPGLRPESSSCTSTAPEGRSATPRRADRACPA
jgi:hypothetical protein